MIPGKIAAAASSPVRISARPMVIDLRRAIPALEGSVSDRLIRSLLSFMSLLLGVPSGDGGRILQLSFLLLGNRDGCLADGFPPFTPGTSALECLAHGVFHAPQGDGNRRKGVRLAYFVHYPTARREKLHLDSAGFVDAPARSVHVLQRDPHVSHPACKTQQTCLKSSIHVGANRVQQLGLMNSNVHANRAIRGSHALSFSRKSPSQRCCKAPTNGTRTNCINCDRSRISRGVLTGPTATSVHAQEGRKAAPGCKAASRELTVSFSTLSSASIKSLERTRGVPIRLSPRSSMGNHKQPSSKRVEKKRVAEDPPSKSNSGKAVRSDNWYWQITRSNSIRRISWHALR